MNGIYGHGGVFLLSKSEELSTTGGSTDFPRTGAADRDDRKPVTGDHNALCDFCRPPDQLRALIHLERVFNGFVTTFTPNREHRLTFRRACQIRAQVALNGSP
jgi:hypothetical protein